MSIEGLKIYGICLERLQFQIERALSRVNGSTERVILESYLTSDPEEIIELLELFDIHNRDIETVMQRLGELAEDVSLMIRKKVEFGFSQEGQLCLYLVLK